jgi:hypothetical protein
MIKSHWCYTTPCVPGRPDSCVYSENCKKIQIPKKLNEITLEKLEVCRAFANFRQSLALANFKMLNQAPRIYKYGPGQEVIIPEDMTNGLDRVVLYDDGRSQTLDFNIKYPCDLCAIAAGCPNSMKELETESFVRNTYEPLIGHECHKSPLFITFAREHNCCLTR